MCVRVRERRRGKEIEEQGTYSERERERKGNRMGRDEMKGRQRAAREEKVETSVLSTNYMDKIIGSPQTKPYNKI